MTENSKQAELSRALAEFGYGNLEAALDALDNYTSAHGVADNVSYFRRRILDRLRPEPLQTPALLWRPGTRGLWEQSWLDAVLPKLPDLGDNVDPAQLRDRILFVIDNRICSRKLSFYQQAYQAGCRIVLVHLSDEAFEDDYRAYRWCDQVYRNYYSPTFDQMKHVSFFALGYKTGFAAGPDRLQATQRKFVWSFAGDPAKSTRPEMLLSMRATPGGFEHLTGGTDAVDALPGSAYATVMRESIFIPCPVGWVNLDSFRIYEALEAGCIPIVERRAGLDYFTELYGSIPFPSLLAWSEAPMLIKHSCEHGLVDELQRSCRRWWSKYKLQLMTTLLSTIERLS